MRRWLVGVLVLCLAALVLVGCQGEKKAENRALTIGLMPDIGMFPLLVAENEGYFTDEELNVELIVFKSAKDRDAALQGGQLNGTMSDLLAVYFLNNSDVKVKATTVTESRFLIMGAQNAGINTIADLANVEIGISPNTVIEYFVDTVLAADGVSALKSSVPQVPVRMELLRSGQLKAASMPDPLATVLTKAGAVILADSRNMDMDPAVLIFTEQTLTGQEKAVEDMFNAYNKAVDAINADPEKYRHLLLEKGGFPEAVIADIEIPRFRKAFDPTEEEVARILNWVKEKGLQKKELTYNDLVQRGLY